MKSVVYEASDRLGGRIHSVNSPSNTGKAFDICLKYELIYYPLFYRICKFCKGIRFILESCINYSIDKVDFRLFPETICTDTFLVLQNHIKIICSIILFL